MLKNHSQMSCSEQVTVSEACCSPGRLVPSWLPEAPHLVTPSIPITSTLQKAFVITECSHSHWSRCLLVCVVSQPNSSFKMLFVTMGLCQLRLLKGYAMGVGHREACCGGEGQNKCIKQGISNPRENMYFKFRDFWMLSEISDIKEDRTGRYSSKFQIIPGS